MYVDFSAVWPLVLPVISGTAGWLVGMWLYCKFSKVRKIFGNPLEDYLHELYEKNQWPPFNNPPT